MKGVFELGLRFTFIEKTESEVGANKEWPIPVTRDQLAKVGYRAKDAWFTAGSLDITFDTGSTSLAISGVEPYIGQLFTYDVASFAAGRGYYNPSPIPAGPAPTPPDFTPYFLSPYTQDGIDYYDVGNNEHAMWLPVGLDGPPKSPRFNAYPDSFVTAFSTNITGIGGLRPEGPIYYGPYMQDAGGYYVGNIQVEFSGEVAWIDDDASGNPLSPGNRLFLGVTFYASGPGIGIVEIASMESLLTYSPTLASINFSIELTESEFVSCPLYYAHDGYGSFVSESGYDFVIKTKEWWPYAKGVPNVPVWDSANGALL